MSTAKTLQFTLERTIPAPVGEVFDAWLDRSTPGTPWNEAEQCILNPTVDGLFYWKVRQTAHYGRFTTVERPCRIAHTWVSPNTLGEESTVTVTFEARGDETHMTLVHADLPDHERARSHENGWKYFLSGFTAGFDRASDEASRAAKAAAGGA